MIGQCFSLKRKNAHGKRRSGIQDPVGLGWLGVLQGAGAAAWRVAPGTGSREEALIHIWKTEPNRRMMKVPLVFGVVGLVWDPSGPSRLGRFVSLEQPWTGLGPVARPETAAQGPRELDERPDAQHHERRYQGFSLLCLSRLCASGNSFPGHGARR